MDGKRPDKKTKPDYDRPPEAEPHDAQTHQTPGVRSEDAPTKRNSNAVAIVAGVVFFLVLLVLFILYGF